MRGKRAVKVYETGLIAIFVSNFVCRRMFCQQRTRKHNLVSQQYKKLLYIKNFLEQYFGSVSLNKKTWLAERNVSFQLTEKKFVL